MANQALEGVKVAALVQGVTGPLATAILASHGAQVLRIESRTWIEWHRQAGPFIDNISCDREKRLADIFSIFVCLCFI